MKRAMFVTAALTLLALAGVSATDQWPQFRGPLAGVVADDPALPTTWNETDNIVWKTSIPGLGWSSPVVWDDHVFLTSAISTGQEVAPVKGLYDPGDEHGKMKSTAPHRWIVYDVDFKTGKIRWERELRDRAAADHQTHQEQLRVGNAGHRWRTGVRLLRQHRAGRGAGPEWQARLDQGHRSIRRSSRVRHGRLAGPLQGPPIRGQRQQHPIVHRGVRQADGRRALEGQTRGGRELVDAVRLGERGAHRDRDNGHGQGPLLRPRRQAAVGAQGHDREHRSDTVRERRTGLHQFGLPGRSGPSGLRHSPGRVR